MNVFGTEGKDFAVRFLKEKGWRLNISKMRLWLEAYISSLFF